MTENSDSAAAASATAQPDPYQSIAYLEALDDIDSRFILNLPDSELASPDRIFIQLEQAWWFYEDLLCDPRPDLNLPRFSTLKPFARALFDYSPRLPNASHHFNEMWNEYIQYKRNISNYGCILLDTTLTKIVLCQVYNGKSYTLPAGKINQGEDGPAAAARETYEETGFDPSCRSGLTATWLEKSPALVTWNRDFNDADMLTHQDKDKQNKGKHRTAYIVAGVPDDFPFAPVCRKEVSQIEWFTLDCLPSNNFAVLPFIRPLREWIRSKKPKKERTDKSRERGKKGTSSSTPKRQGASSRGRSSRGRGAVSSEEQDLLLATGLVDGTSTSEVIGWSEDDMFATNERLLNRKVEYDGNPHVFVEEGLTRTDPHAYRIVGGTLLNSAAGATSTVPPPPISQLQPLVRRETDMDVLTPFFSSDGATPWGDVIADAKPERLPTIERSNSTGARSTGHKKKPTRAVEPRHEAAVVADATNFIPTDAQITAQSQAVKLSQPPPFVSSTALQQHDDNRTFIQEWAARLPLPIALLDKTAIQQHVEQRSVGVSDVPVDHHIRQWVDTLPRPRPNKYFGSFRLDADAIMAQVKRDVPALR